MGYAYLSRTLFDETRLQGTLLYGPDLSEAQMLTQEQIDKAHGAKRENSVMAKCALRHSPGPEGLP